MKLKWTFFLLLLLHTLQSMGVEVLSRKLNSDNGLPDNNVRHIVQDAKGFIWMGTPNGLYRFDGYFFTTYKYSETGNARLLNNNHIQALYTLPDNRLLIAEQGHQFSVFDIEENRFVELPEKEKELLYDSCRKKDIDPKVEQRFRSVIDNGGGIINDNLGNNVVIDHTGLLWFIDRQTGETIQMRVFDEDLFPLVSSKKFKVVTSQRRQLIWVSTNGCGITVYDRKEKTVKHIRQDSGLIASDYIIDMCLDSDDNVWVADEFHGVEYLIPAENHMTVRLLNQHAKGLRDNQVYVMRWLADSTLLIANTKGDVYKTDRYLNMQDKPTWEGLDVHSACSDKEGKTWIGTRQKGLRAGNGKWYAHDEHNPNSISSNNIYYMLCDQKGRIWIAPEDSYLDLAIPTSDSSYEFRHFFNEKFSARVLFQDHHGVMWVGTKDGLYRFLPDELINDHSAYEQVLNGQELKYSDVSCIYEDSQGLLWVGTIGKGVYSIDNTKRWGSQKFANLSASHGLISDEVHAIIEDGHGVLWFATKKGITCYNPKTKRFWYHYDEYDLLRNYYADNSACRMPDGRLAFGTNAGIIVYDVNKATENISHTAKLAITDLIINGVSANQMDGMDLGRGLKEINLSYQQNLLTFHFSAFNFKAASSTRYSYWLEGYDKEWSELTDYSFATYKQLPPGHYVFHVKAYDNYSLSTQETTMSVIIHYPWWRSWWAYLAYTFLTLLLGYLVYRQLRTVYRLRQRIEVEKRLTEYKLQFFTNISHEFRTPLTIIRGAIDRIKRAGDIPADMRQPVSSMNRSVSRMLRLINQLLEFRKMQNDKLRLALEETDVVRFLHDIFLSFSDIAENKHINYSFSTQERSYVMFVDRSHLDKIVYNILSNAFKYTPSHGDISLQVRFSDKKMTISIKDSGVGIPKEKQPELFKRFMQSNFSNDSIGIGLNLTKALVEVHHGTIGYTPNEPKGSVFTVDIPTDKNVYATEDFLAEGHQLLVQNNGADNDKYKELASLPMNNRTVLIVEDDSDVMDYMENFLQKYFVVHKAADGVEAIQMLEQLRPDLIVSDIMMPVMDGLELTAHIRQTEEMKDIPIILLTALTTDDKRIKAMEKGADAYITKPFDTQLLVATAVRLIQQRDIQKAQYMQQTAEGKTVLPEIIVDERDKHLLDVMNTWLDTHLSDPTLSVDAMAEAMGYRRTIFFKKIKALTGQTPAEYIKTLRMNRAAELLREETITVAEVCYKVGINDPHYFAKVFKQQFGISPKKYQQGGKKESE